MEAREGIPLRKEFDIYLKKIADDIRNIRATFDNLIIYGAGVRGRQLFCWLKKHSIIIDYFCVTKIKSGELKELCNKPIEEIGHLSKITLPAFYLIASSPRYTKEIESTLHNYGVKDYLIFPEWIWDTILNEIFFRPTLEITPKVGCSINCRYCPQELLLSRYYQDNSISEMSFDVFKTCIDNTPSNLIVDFSGFVEPFLAKDAIRMIRYANTLGRDIRLYTTLVGLKMQDFDLIKDIPFKKVVLHLPDENHWAHIPINDSYLNLLDMVLSTSKADGTPFVDSATCQAKPPADILALIGNRTSISWDLIDRAGNLEKTAEGGSVLKSSTKHEGKVFCSRSINLNHNVLLPNGDVVICCMDFGLRHKLGNLINQPYEEICSGAENTYIKEKMFFGGEGTLCASCTAVRRLAHSESNIYGHKV